MCATRTVRPSFAVEKESRPVEYAQAPAPSRSTRITSQGLIRRRRDPPERSMRRRARSGPGADFAASARAIRRSVRVAERPAPRAARARAGPRFARERGYGFLARRGLRLRWLCVLPRRVRPFLNLPRNEPPRVVFFRFAMGPSARRFARATNVEGAAPRAR